MRFREFIDNDDQKDIERTLSKLPSSHADLVRGYHWNFQPGNTLKGDQEHIGYIDHAKREIVVAAPWNYGREFTILHEIGHCVWEFILSTKDRLHWKMLAKQTPLPKRDRQEPEELWCHAYATTYCKRPPLDYCKPQWIDFVKSIQSGVRTPN